MNSVPPLALSSFDGPQDFYGPNVLNAQFLAQLVKQDHGLGVSQKESLLSMLSHPDAINRILSGVAGAALAKTIASYAKMSKPAQALLSLAGFGIGNIIYNSLHKKNFVEYDHETGTSRIKL